VFLISGIGGIVEVEARYSVVGRVSRCWLGRKLGGE